MFDDNVINFQCEGIYRWCWNLNFILKNKLIVVSEHEKHLILNWYKAEKEIGYLVSTFETLTFKWSTLKTFYCKFI